jgi:hypothetical protein
LKIKTQGNLSNIKAKLNFKLTMPKLFPILTITFLSSLTSDNPQTSLYFNKCIKMMQAERACAMKESVAETTQMKKLTTSALIAKALQYALNVSSMEPTRAMRLPHLERPTLLS